MYKIVPGAKKEKKGQKVFLHSAEDNVFCWVCSFSIQFLPFFLVLPFSLGVNRDWI
jgi:hypothetical protein